MKEDSKRTKVCIYARVSTSAQDYDHQLRSLREFAEKNNYDVVMEFTEKISGAKRIAERQALMELMEFVRGNAVDKILIFECSRLSRRAADFLNIIEELNELGISLHILQNGLETLLPDGKVNPIASLVLGILAQFNSMERTLIRSRMEAGYENYRGKGGVVGRKVGYKKSDMQMIADYPEEIRLIRKDYSLRNISKITNTSVNTIMKLKRIVC